MSKFIRGSDDEEPEDEEGREVLVPNRSSLLPQNLPKLIQQLLKLESPDDEECKRRPIRFNKRVLMDWAMEQVCPGCRGREGPATSKNGDKCPECRAYVHRMCQVYLYTIAEARTITEPDMDVFACPDCGHKVAKRPVW